MSDTDGWTPEQPSNDQGPRAASSSSQWQAFEAEHASLSRGFRSLGQLCRGSQFPTAIFWSSDLRLVYNDPFALLLGRRHPAAFGRAGNQFESGTWLGLESLVRHVFAVGEAVHREEFYVSHDRNGRREECYFAVSLTVFVDEEQGRGVLCILHETTASVLAARAANERIAELADFYKLADNIADIVYLHGADGAIVWANERWYSFTGLPRETSTGLDMWSQIMPAHDLKLYIGALERALPTSAAYEIEISLKSVEAPQTAYRLHLIRAKPIFDDDGLLLRWAASATDIHDRRIAENDARERLERERDREHRTSLAFQHAAMPNWLPNSPGLTFSAVYEPAEAEALVGGDWYDAFRLADGRIVVSVGDVMGSGLAAAVTMAAVRQAIRGAAHIYPDPGAVLDAADRALRSEQPDRIVTAFVAVLDPITLSLTFASAGHPAPMLRRPKGDIVELMSPDFPLGLRSERQKGSAPNAQIVVEPGSVLVIYTDGLTEATHDLFEGERRLREALLAAPSIDPADMARHIRETVLSSSKDDVAILTVSFGQRVLGGGPQTLSVHSRWSFAIADSSAASSARREILDVLNQLGIAPEEATDVELVLAELLSNVMRHAHGGVEVVLDLDNEAPVLHVLDTGPGFTFNARLPHDQMAESGRGLHIVSMLVRDLSVGPRLKGGSHARAVLDIGSLRQ